MERFDRSGNAWLFLPSGGSTIRLCRGMIVAYQPNGGGSSLLWLMGQGEAFLVDITAKDLDDLLEIQPQEGGA